MISTRIKIKLLILIVLAVSTFGLTRATAEEACSQEQCVRISENGRPVGYGCVNGGDVKRKCVATLTGCTYDSCPGFVE